MTYQSADEQKLNSKIQLQSVVDVFMLLHKIDPGRPRTFEELYRTLKTEVPGLNGQRQEVLEIVETLLSMEVLRKETYNRFERYLEDGKAKGRGYRLFKRVVSTFGITNAFHTEVFYLKDPSIAS